MALLRPSVWYAKSEARDQSAPRLRIREIAMDCARFGFLCVQVLLKREDREIGEKRVYRLYQLERLPLRMKVKRRKRINPQRGANPCHRTESAPEHALRARSDAQRTGIPGAHGDRSVQSRECDSRGQLPTHRPVRRVVKLAHTRPGKSTDNGLIESFSGRLRDEFLNVNEFIATQDAREKWKAWRYDHNHHRPHGLLGHLTPSEFVRKRSDQQLESRPTPVEK